MITKPEVGIYGLRNPIALISVGTVGVVRGGVYLASHFPNPEWLGAEVGPSIPLFPLWTAGAAWLFAGLFLLVALVIPAWFKSAIALMVGLYVTWSIIYLTDLFLTPDLSSMVSLAIYLALVPVVLTLGQVEIDKDEYKRALASMGE